MYRRFIPWRTVATLFRKSLYLILLCLLFAMSTSWFYIQSYVKPIATKQQVQQDQFQRAHNTTNVPFVGAIEVHHWREVCVKSISSLVQLPQYPLYPNLQQNFTLSETFSLRFKEKNSGHRVAGHIIPLSNGFYRFGVESIAPWQLWIGTSENPKSSRKVSEKTTTTRELQITDEMLLAGGKNYYYEILHVMGDVIQSDTLTLKCYVIGLKYIKPILILPAMIRDPAVLKEFLESSPASDLTPTEELLGNPNNTKSALNYTVDLEHLDSIALETVFSNCSYDPSYQQKRDYKKYEGATSGTYFTKTYPKDGSWISDCPASEGGFCLGNDVIDQRVVDEVIEMFMKSLEKAYPRKYSLEKIIGIEEKEDKQRGSRYLLELILIDNPTKSKLRVLNYFFKFKNKSTLCIPARLALRMDTVINIVLTVSAQKVWILHFIRDLAQVIRDSNDQNVNVIIAYYGNDPASLEYELKRKDIKNFTVIPLTGRFHKTYAIQKAVSSVRDKDSIVFLLDLHLRMPSNILESVRKHTIQGVLAYSPIVFRLSECAGPGTREHPSKGFFQKNGFGIFSIYKSDWDVFGGMNVKDFKHAWGGEDWDLADRVLNSGIEIERLMLPGFYHFFHSHSGMWDIS